MYPFTSSKNLLAVSGLRATHGSITSVVVPDTDVPQWLIEVEGILVESQKPPSECGTTVHVGVQENVVALKLAPFNWL